MQGLCEKQTIICVYLNIGHQDVFDTSQLFTALFKQNGLPSLNTWKSDLKATEESNIWG